MKHLLALAAGITLTATSLGVNVESAHADPPLMSHPEYVAVSAGQSRPAVETNCGGCTGTVLVGAHAVSGGTAKVISYTTPVGHAHVEYRQKTGESVWRAWLLKEWCVNTCNGDTL